MKQVRNPRIAVVEVQTGAAFALEVAVRTCRGRREPAPMTVCCDADDADRERQFGVTAGRGFEGICGTFLLLLVCVLSLAFRITNNNRLVALCAAVLCPSFCFC